MMKQYITDMTLNELSAALLRREVSSVEATCACLELIKSDEYNNFITVCENDAITAAKHADALIASGRGGALCGVPIAVKDNISTKGVATTCASEFLRNYVPPFDATVVERLKQAGAVILGKTNMDEFAMGSTNENSAFGAVKNSRDVTRVPGGSSGGSANAVAACEAFAALGSDTGGSIRQPASYCGAVGLKPTYSAVSRYGLVAFASSLDQIGPIARNVDDAYTVFRTIAGRDERDATSAAYDFPSLPPTDDVRGKKIGVADEFIKGLKGEAYDVFSAALAALERRGAEIVKISIGSFDAALAVYYVLSSAEAAANLSRYDGVKYGRRAEGYSDVAELYKKSRTQFFGSEVKRRIMIGNFVLSSGYYDEYYLKASKVRTVIKNDFDRALSDCDAIVCPTAPTAAPKLGSQTDPVKTYLSDIYTVPANITGLPAVSVPFGKSHDGMPIGVQVMGRAFSEYGILGVGKAIANGGVAC